jgi:NTE family protein
MLNSAISTLILFAVLILLTLTSHAQTVSEPHVCQLGLTLSGGAARGIAHIGVIRAFEEAGIKIDYISGSSMGAVVGLFYAAGKTPDEMLAIAKSIKKRRLTSTFPIHLRKKGLDYMEQILKKHIAVQTFDQLKKPLYVCVTNFESGRYEMIEQGEIIPAIRASAAISLYFPDTFISKHADDD